MKTGIKRFGDSNLRMKDSKEHYLGRIEDLREPL
jgi:hypothetical protein